MKRLLLPLLAALALPTAVNVNVDPEVHNLCKDVSDYMGCVKANSKKEGWNPFHKTTNEKKRENRFNPLKNLTKEQKAEFKLCVSDVSNIRKFKNSSIEEIKRDYHLVLTSWSKFLDKKSLLGLNLGQEYSTCILQTTLGKTSLNNRQALNYCNCINDLALEMSIVLIVGQKILIHLWLVI